MVLLCLAVPGWSSLVTTSGLAGTSRPIFRPRLLLAGFWFLLISSWEQEELRKVKKKEN